MPIAQKHVKTLELDKVLQMLSEHASCEESKQLALTLEPETSLFRAQALLRETSDANALSVRFGTPKIYQFKNIVTPVKRAELGTSLSLKDLLDVSNALRTIRSLCEWQKQCDEMPESLSYFFNGLTPIPAVEDRINSAIISDELIADHASPALADIRRKIRVQSAKVKEQLDKMIHSATYQKYLQDNLVTMRDGRYVVPVKAEYRGEVKGLIHDTSGSGATVFIEPMGVVEANNEIRILQGKEQEEIERILAELSALVGEYSESILRDYRSVLEIDLIFAKSRLADRMNAIAPQMNEEGIVDLRKARHPLLNKDTVVPVDIHLGKTFDTLIITGPNTGGKTVALKTVGLFTLMAMCGLMIPAAEPSSLSVFSKVLADIGEEQSIEQNLSTFSAHMVNIRSILEEADQNSLVLLDELGAGTDPVEGAALAISIVEDLREKQAKILLTTHYAEMKLFALETPGVENGSCEFDVRSLRPTYKLSIGIPGKSNAFAISGRIGISEKIINRAREQVSHENTKFEDAVSTLEETRQTLQRELDSAQNLRQKAQKNEQEIAQFRETLEKEREKILESTRNESRRIIEKVRADSEAMLEEIQKLRKEAQSENAASIAAKARAQLRSGVGELYAIADQSAGTNTQEEYVLPRPLQVGDTVFVTELGNSGTVRALPDKNGMVSVQSGLMKVNVKLSSLRLADAGPAAKSKKQPPKGSVKISGKSSQRSSQLELDLRGMDVENALVEIDRFIDHSVLSGLKIVTIIHGKGTGALRAAAHKHLRQHKNIRTFRLGTFGEGESGVTIAEIK